MRLRSSIAALGLIAATAPALAAGPVARPKTYGTQDQIVLTLGPCDAHDRSPTTPFQVFTCDFLKAGQDNVFNSAAPAWPLHLPEGALLEQVDFHYYDTIDGSQPFVSLVRMGADATDQIINDNLPAFSGGINDATFVITPPREIHNLNAMYVLSMQLDTTDATHYEGLYWITVRYRLQVSPASISKAITFLESQDLVRRQRDEGRRERYVVDDDLWYQAMMRSARDNAQLADTARQGVGILGPDTKAAARLRNIARYLDYIGVTITRAAQQARDVLDGEPDATSGGTAEPRSDPG